MRSTSNTMQDQANDPLSGPEISDEDVLDAMRHIPGYLDITAEDFRTLYTLAHAHAVTRTFVHVRAERLMRTGVQPVGPDTMLDQAAHAMVDQGLKAIPVSDSAGRVVGMLTETDFLRRLRAQGFLGLMLELMADPAGFSHRCHETPVSAAMSAPAVTLPPEADFAAIAAAFRRCPGRSLPVVDRDGRLLGLLLRKHFVDACHLEPLA
jgi:CBS domain-containing membrane protein